MNKLIDQAQPELMKRVSDYIAQSRKADQIATANYLVSIQSEVSASLEELKRHSKAELTALTAMIIDHLQSAQKASTRATRRKALIFLRQTRKIGDYLFSPCKLIVPAMMVMLVMLMGFLAISWVKNIPKLEEENTFLKANFSKLMRKQENYNRVTLKTEGQTILALVPEEQWPQFRTIDRESGRWIVLKLNPMSP